MQILQDYLDEKQAAEELHQKPTTLAVWRSQKRGPAYTKIGRRVFYKVEDLRAFVKAGAVTPGEAR